MAYLIDICGLALLSLRGQWLRALLSVVGIAIGISAFTITASVNQGGRDMVFTELQTFGLRSMWVQRDYPMLDIGSGQFVTGSGIDSGDVDEIRNCCTAIAFATPILNTRKSNQARVRNNTSQGQLLGVGRDYLRINTDTVSIGRTFNAEDERTARKVILIGARTRDDLFADRSSVLGELVQLGGHTYQVIGVLAEKKRDFLNSIGVGQGDDPNRRILLPYTTVQRVEQRPGEVDTLQLEMTAFANAAQAQDQVARVLKRNHGTKYQYRFDDMQKYVQAAERIVQTISLVGLLASVMSLLVGGIGVANVMAMSVLERTSEIGVRKALGATRRAILMQFAVEAIAIGVIGGVIGIMLSYGVLNIARQFTQLATNPSGAVLFYAVLVAALAGGFAGLYPSYVAATMKPAEALRA